MSPRQAKELLETFHGLNWDYADSTVKIPFSEANNFLRMLEEFSLVDAPAASAGQEPTPTRGYWHCSTCKEPLVSGQTTTAPGRSRYHIKCGHFVDWITSAQPGCVMVPRDALECFMTTINAACQQLEGSVLYIQDQDMRASAAELAKHYHSQAAALQSALSPSALSKEMVGAWMKENNYEQAPMQSRPEDQAEIARLSAALELSGKANLALADELLEARIQTRGSK